MEIWIKERVTDDEIVLSGPGGWVVVAEYASGAPVVGPHTLRLHLTEPEIGGELTTEMLRAIPLTQLAEIRGEWFAARSDWTLPVKRDDLFYATVARMYAEQVRAGRRHAVAAVAKPLGVSEPSIRQWLTRARDRGLLTEATTGKVSGELTDKGKAVLAAAEEA